MTDCGEALSWMNQFAAELELAGGAAREVGRCAAPDVIHDLGSCPVGQNAQSKGLVRAFQLDKNWNHTLIRWAEVQF